MSSNIGIDSSNPFQNATDIIHFSGIENLKSTLDEIDMTNIRTSFKTAKDPIYLAFDHINKQPLKKIAKDFTRDIFDNAVEFITSIPDWFRINEEDED